MDWTDNNWFLGTDNQHVSSFICGMCIALINAKLCKQRARALCLIVACYVSIFWVWSATAVSGIILYLILFLMIYSKRFPFINYLNLCIANLVIFFSIIIFKVQNLFQFFIEDFLGKNMTFTGRVYIWEKAIYWIKKSWIIGNGYENPYLHAKKTIFPSCHNILLEHMYQGGILLILCLVAIHICVGKKLMTYSNTYYAGILAISIFVLYFMMLFEVYSLTRIYPLFILAFHIEELLKQSKKVIT